MFETDVRYKLVQLRSGETAAYASAISIYARSFDPSVKTNTNEISYWLEKYSQFAPDEFLVFAFSANEAVIGYAQLALFSDERLLAVDYLVIDERYRQHNVFFEFVAHLRSMVDHKALYVDYVVAEVAQSPHHNNKQLLRLLRLVGFGVVRAPYIQPQLGAGNTESEIPALLTILGVGNRNIKQIRKETYLRIVHTIFFKHYLRWYSIYPSQEKAYRTHLNKLYRRIEKGLSRTSVLRVNGDAHAQDGHSLVRIRDARTVGFMQNSLLFIIVVTVLILGVQQLFDVPLFSVVAAFLLTLVSVFAVYALFSKNAAAIFKDLVKLLSSFGRPK